MPELAIARDRNLNLPAFKPLVLDNQIAQAQYTPDLREAARTQAQTASIGAIGQAISSIPDLILESYEKGRKLRQQGVSDKLVKDAIAGKGSNTLASLGYKTDGKGGYTIDPAGAAYKQSLLDKHKQNDPEAQNYQEKQLLDQDRSTPVTGPLSSMQTPSNDWRITDYNGALDPTPDANSSAGIGAWDNQLEPGVSMAVSRDIEHQFSQQGIKPQSMVNVTLADGRTIPVRWDDRTAAKFQGKDLTGRFDIYSPTGPSPQRGSRVTAFAPVSPTSSVSPEIQTQAEQAAIGAGQQLTEIPTESLSASTAPGPIPAANVSTEAQGPLANLPLAAKGAAITPGRPLEGFDPTLPSGDRRATTGWQGGRTLYSPTPESMTEFVDIAPGKSVRRNIQPDETYKLAQKKLDEAAAKTEKNPGIVFPNAKAAADAGYDPTDAVVNPDGSLAVTKYKPSGTDAKGRSKITDSQKAALSQAAILSKSIDGLMTDYDTLSKKNMAGPVMGRIEKGKQAMGVGSEEGSRIQAEMNTSLFKIARLLNGAGVLTDRDISRAESVAPTITMGRDQFKGQLDAVKSTLRQGLDTWMQTNAGQATDEQIELAKQAISSLGGTASTPTPAAPSPVTESTPAGPVTVNSQAEYDALPSGSDYLDSSGHRARKR